MSTSATLEIHQINVGQGDCTLVLVRDLVKLRERVAKTSMAVANTDSIHHLPYCLANNLSLSGTVQTALLVDAGNDGYGPDVREYLEKVGAITVGAITVTNPKAQLWMLATHYHDDHQDGLRSVMRESLDDDALKIARQVNAKNEKDGIATRVETTKEVVRPDRFYRLAPNKDRDRAMGMFPTILAELQRQQGAPKTEVHEIPCGGAALGKRAEIDLGAGIGGLRIKVVVLAADQAYFENASKARIAIPNKNPRKKSRPLSENDRSVVLMVEYGSFRHFFGGDIGGSTCTIEADVEGALALALPKMLPAAKAQNGPKIKADAHCCSVKLSHHGSRHSNTDSMFARLTPRLAVVSSGFRQYFHGHPTADVVQRMATTTLTNAYATEIASKGKGKPFDPDPSKRVSILGDIVIRPIDESIATLHQQSGTGGNKLDIQVYGSGAQSWIDPGNASYELRATAAKNAPGNYPIGPFTISCDGH